MNTSNVSLNIDLNKLKTMAKKLKEELNSIGQNITLMQSYELVAKQIGFKNYNTAQKLIMNNAIKNEKSISYVFNFSSREIKNILMNKIYDALETLESKNKDFKYEMKISKGFNKNLKTLEAVNKNEDFDHRSTLLLNLCFNPASMAYDAMIIDVLLISTFQKELLSKSILVEKRDVLVRDEKTSVNESLLKALKKVS